MSVEKKRRYIDGDGNVIASVDNGADAVNVDFAPGTSGMESTNVNAAIIEAYSHADDALDSLTALNSINGKKAIILPLVAATAVTQMSVTESENDSAAYCAMQSYINIPYDGCKFKFKLPQGIRAAVLYGSQATNGASGSQGSIEDGGAFTFPKNGTTHYRIYFSATSGNLSLETVNGYIEDGDIEVTYESEDTDVVARNYPNESAVKAAMYKLVNPVTGVNLHIMPVFAHISDLHGDAYRLRNAIEYCDWLGVDAIINTGDNVAYKKENGGRFQELCFDYNTPLLTTVGNHDVYLVSANTESLVFSRHIQPYVTQYGYLSEAETPTTAPYYYKDFASKKIRVIVLNQYEDGIYEMRWGQTQMTWLASTLLATPANYGVIIATHTIPSQVDKDADYTKFWQMKTYTGAAINSYSLGGARGTSTSKIALIIDAFIKGESCSITFAEIDANNTSDGATTTFSADFSTLNSGVEFICFVNGHHHQDQIGYVNVSGVTTKQLVLNVTCGNANYGTGNDEYLANQSDLPRGCDGITQDAFNVFAINRDLGTVRIARVGANMSMFGVVRDFMEIPYK